MITEKQVNEWLTEHPVTQRYLDRLRAIKDEGTRARDDIPTTDKDELFRQTAWLEGAVTQIQEVINLTAADILFEEDSNE